MYLISTSDIKISQDFFTGKWVAVHAPTGVTSSAYDYGLVTQELLLNHLIPLYFESPEDGNVPVPHGYNDISTELVAAEFRESVKNVLIDDFRIKTRRLHFFPTPHAWTAWDNGYRSYGYTEDESKRKLLVCKSYLKSLLDEQFPKSVLAEA
jgi:hypothetical protein